MKTKTIVSFTLPIIISIIFSIISLIFNNTQIYILMAYFCIYPAICFIGSILMDKEKPIIKGIYVAICGILLSILGLLLFKVMMIELLILTLIVTIIGTIINTLLNRKKI